jgi:ketosteroid isomerase-like protein
MTDKTVYALPNAPAVVGAEAIRSLWQAVFDQANYEFSNTVEDVRVAGDLAVVRGTWITNKATAKAQGVADFSGAGSWIEVLSRQNDGSWRFDWVVGNSNQPLPGSTASGEDEQALYQMERDWAAAAVTRDTAVVDKFLAEEFVSSYNGRMQNKKQVLAEEKANPEKVESAANGEIKAMVFGDTAVVHGLFNVKSTTNGKDTSRQSRYTEVYVKRDGRWQCVTQYVTKVQ